MLAEGERNKIIQQPTNNLKNTKKPDNQPVSNYQPEDKTAKPYQNPQPSNSVPFPSTSEPTSEASQKLKKMTLLKAMDKAFAQGNLLEPIKT